VPQILLDASSEQRSIFLSRNLIWRPNNNFKDT